MKQSYNGTIWPSNWILRLENGSQQPDSQFVDVPEDNNKVISDLLQNVTFSEMCSLIP